MEQIESGYSDGARGRPAMGKRMFPRLMMAMAAMVGAGPSMAKGMRLGRFGREVTWTQIQKARKHQVKAAKFRRHMRSAAVRAGIKQGR